MNREGYVRTSSEKFDLNDREKENQFIHLTNNAIQKNNKNYGKFENGNQLSFEDLEVFFFTLKILFFG